MELDVTHFVQTHDMWDFSHSAHEGGQTAGEDTWRAAIKCATEASEAIEGDSAREDLFCRPSTRGEILDWLGEFGAWEEAELRAMSDIEVTALVMQFVAGDARRIIDLARTESYAALARWEENEGGRLSYGDDPLDESARWYLHVGM